jgi:uncharacterized protein YndB with AHSA1/START domain
MTEIEISLHIDASPSTVFRYFVDPQRMREWMGIAVDLDPRPGGVYRVEVTSGQIVLGVFLEVVPDERIVFSFGWEGNDGVPPASTTVEVVLSRHGDGTVVRLRHLGLPDDDALRQHGYGWEHYGARLAIAAMGGDPGPDVYPIDQPESGSSSTTGV